MDPKCRGQTVRHDPDGKAHKPKDSEGACLPKQIDVASSCSEASVQSLAHSRGIANLPV